MNLTRESLERELVRKDKQALITDALKIFDLNESLQRRLLEVSGQVDRYKNMYVEQKAETIRWQDKTILEFIRHKLRKR